MTTQIQLFNSNKYGKVRGYADNNGTVFINVTDVAHGLGFVNKNGVIRLNKINNLLGRFYRGVEVKADDFIPEYMFYRLAMKADNEAANNFQSYLSEEVIPSIRRTGSYSVHTATNNAPALPAPDIRQKALDTTNSLRSIIQKYTYYSYSQGDRRGRGNTFKDYSKYIFRKFMTMSNKISNIQCGCRPTSDSEKQVKLKTAETFIGKTLLKGMASGKNFAQIESEIICEAGKLADFFNSKLPLLGD